MLKLAKNIHELSCDMQVLVVIKDNPKVVRSIYRLDLATQLQISEKSVHRALDKLEELGFIEILKRGPYDIKLKKFL